MEKQFVDRAAEILSRIYREEKRKTKSVDEAARDLKNLSSPGERTELLFWAKRVDILYDIYQSKYQDKIEFSRDLKKKIFALITMVENSGEDDRENLAKGWALYEDVYAQMQQIEELVNQIS